MITKFDPPPIPFRNCDWCAYLEDDVENSNRYGWGKTEAEAILNLEEILTCDT
jgi:hypothetical protein